MEKPNTHVCSVMENLLLVTVKDSAQYLLSETLAGCCLSDFLPPHQTSGSAEKT